MFEPYISSFPRSSANDLKLSTKGAHVVDFEVVTNLKTNKWAGENRTTIILASQSVNIADAILTIEYSENTKKRGVIDFSQWSRFHSDVLGMDSIRRAEIVKNIREVEAKLLGKFVLNIGDGYEYQCVLDTIGTSKWYGDSACVKTYSLSVVKTLSLVEVSLTGADSSIVCNSTVPKTDCSITLTGTFNLARKIFTLGDLVFDSTYALSSPLVLDGINKTITANGVNAVSQFAWTDFPYLVPGNNTFSLTQGVESVAGVGIVFRYYPTFI